MSVRRQLLTQERGHRSIAFSGGTCRLEATEAALVLRLDATDPAPLETLQEFVARHLLRFAFRAPPATAGSMPPPDPLDGSGCAWEPAGNGGNIAMTWSILGASLAAHDLAASSHFFGTLLGLGGPRAVDAQTLVFGGQRGLRLRRPGRVLTAGPGWGELLGPAGARHVAIEVDDLHRVAATSPRQRSRMSRRMRRSSAGRRCGHWTRR